MLGIQVAIGALNDVVDAPLDALAKPRKPIVAGLVDGRVGLAVAGGGATVGIVLSAVSGAPTAVVAGTCIGLGWLYDLRLSRTSLSWAPLALALPLLPVHAWLGAAGSVPGSVLLLVPIGVLAGAGLALANGIVDADRDAASGRSGIAVALGRQRGWIVQTLLLATAGVLALVGAPQAALSPDAPAEGLVAALVLVRQWGIVVGCGALALGALILASPNATVRERGWELEAIGVLGLGIGWLAGASAVSQA